MSPEIKHTSESETDKIPQEKWSKLPEVLQLYIIEHEEEIFLENGSNKPRASVGQRRHIREQKRLGLHRKPSRAENAKTALHKTITYLANVQHTDVDESALTIKAIWLMIAAGKLTPDERRESVMSVYDAHTANFTEEQEEEKEKYKDEIGDRFEEMRQEIQSLMPTYN